MSREAREAAERAWADLAGQYPSLLHLDQLSGFEQVVVLAGFAPRGFAGFGPVQRIVGELLRDGASALPVDHRERLESLVAKSLASLQHGDGGKVVVRGDVRAADGDTPSLTAEGSESSSSASDWWPFFYRSVQSRLCETLVPALLGGHANLAASLEQRSACLRAACGVFWWLENVHYGPTQVPLLARSVIEDLELSAADEHAPLVGHVLLGCDEDTLVGALREPAGADAQWRFSSDYRSCVWGEERFSFTENQGRILRALHEEHDRSGCGLGVDALVETASLGSHRPEGVSEGGVIRHAFRTRTGMHPCWQTMLRKVGRDAFVLVAPPLE